MWGVGGAQRARISTHRVHSTAAYKNISLSSLFFSLFLALSLSLYLSVCLSIYLSIFQSLLSRSLSLPTADLSRASLAAADCGETAGALGDQVMSPYTRA